MAAATIQRPETQGNHDEPEWSFNKSKPADYFMPLNRNLANYPLARDRRTRLQWARGKPSRDWYCDLPGEPRVRLRFPVDTPEDLRRCPSPFDMNLLFLLLAQATASKRPAIRFDTRAELLQRLRLGAYSDNLKALVNAIEFWSTVEIRFDHWRYARLDGHQVNEDGRTLPPPVEVVEPAGKGLRLKIAKSWLPLDRGFYVQVPLPLPAEAAVQNLCVWLLTAIRRSDNKQLTFPQEVARLAATIGLARSGPAAMVAVAERAKQWFAANGGALQWSQVLSTIDFTIGDVKLPARKRLRKPKAGTMSRVGTMDAELRAIANSSHHVSDDDDYVADEFNPNLEKAIYEDGSVRYVRRDGGPRPARQRG